MTARKGSKSKTKQPPKQTKPKDHEEYAFPSEQERLPAHIPGTYQVAMDTRQEIGAWLQAVPKDSQAILIQFLDEASYRLFGPTFWHIALRLPEIVARIQRRRFEQIVDAMTR
jgi:hypothetical protein